VWLYDVAVRETGSHSTIGIEFVLWPCVISVFPALEVRNSVCDNVILDVLRGLESWWAANYQLLSLLLLPPHVVYPEHSRKLQGWLVDENEGSTDSKG
jgi:hypothetical protein